MTADADANGRLLARVDGTADGPLVVAIAGVHGNEPAGLDAARRVADALRAGTTSLRGSFVALAGNRAALRAGTRFVTHDLGRLWTSEEVARARGTAPATHAEQAELRELVRAVDALVAEADGRELVFIELHSTSAPGMPFQAINDTLHDRAIALASPLPLVLGVEESVRGSLLDYMDREGRSVIVLEGGEHTDPDTADHLEAALWLVLAALGGVDAAAPAIAPHRARLAAATGGAPAVAEIVYRHHVEPDDGFAPQPGLRHFRPVRRGEVVGRDRRGPVCVPLDGLLLMPKYQAQGHDGYFVARAVRRGWLDVSAAMRRLGVDRILPYLPGVRRDPHRPRRLVVDTHVARWLVAPIFHLCGFRRLPSRDGRMVFARRLETPRGA